MSIRAAKGLELLQKATENKRLAHAYLITWELAAGDEGVAEVNDLVFKFVKNINNLQNVNSFEDLSEIHSVKIIFPASKSRKIRVEEVRQLEHFLQLSSERNNVKIAIIQQAETMTLEAANAFLKTLEEPPPNSLIFMLSPQPEILLATILSRCLLLKINCSKQETLDNFLEPEHVIFLRRDLQKIFSNNKIESLFLLNFCAQIFKILNNIKEKIDVNHVQQLEFLKGQRERNPAFNFFREEEKLNALQHAKYLEKRSLFISLLQRESFQNILNNLTNEKLLKSLLKKASCWEELQNLLKKNVNEKLAFESMILQLK